MDVVLYVERMCCENCARVVGQALDVVPGVGRFCVDLTKRTIALQIDSDTLTPSVLCSVVSQTGYEAVEANTPLLES